MFLANDGEMDGELQDWKQNLTNFFNSTVLMVIIWGVTLFFGLLLIKAGVAFAMAKTPEEKNAAKGKLIQLVIGFAIVLGAASIVTVLGSVFEGLWGKPSINPNY